MLRSVPPTRCVRRLARGEVKRVPSVGRLVGYYVACPGCGFVAPYLAEEAGWIESADPELHLVGAERPPPCMRCRRAIGVVDGALSVA